MKRGSKSRAALYPVFVKSFAPLMRGFPPRLVAACSGGPDSMALLDLLTFWQKSAPGRLVAVCHVDHGLRGRASRRDALFVQNQARRRGLPFLLEKAPVRAWSRSRGLGVEEASRVLRYQALARAAGAARCRFVATAHTLNDQAETFFMNIIRGAGPMGLAAMRASSGWPVPGAPHLRLLRPLLDISRNDVLKHLRAAEIPFQVDDTNRDPVFFRNRVRPVLQKWEKERPGLLRRVSQLCLIQQDEEDFWRGRLEAAKPRVFRQRKGLKNLDLEKFKRYHISIQRRLLRQIFGLSPFWAVEGVRSLADSPAGRRLSLPGGVWAERMEGAIRLHPHTSNPGQ